MLSLQNAFLFLIDYIFGFYLLAVWLRLYLQYRRANFHNPICLLIIKITDPLLVPLRRVVPGFKGVDFSSVVLMLLVAIVEVVLMLLIRGYSFDSEFLAITLFVAIINCIKVVINSFFWGIILRSILSFVHQAQFSPLSEIAYYLSEPLLAPIRKKVHPVSGIDLSPIIALLILGFVKIALGL